MSQLECFVAVGLVNGQLVMTVTNGALRPDGSILVEPDLSEDSVIFATKNFSSGSDDYRVEGYTVTPNGDVAWAADPNRADHFISATTVREGQHSHKISGQIKIKAFGPLGPNGSSNNEVDTVEPPTTVVFEDDLGGGPP